MGKIVKYCANCEEGFAEKFSFCPNCASALTAYEMNPAKPTEVLKVAEPVENTEPEPTNVISTLPPVEAQTPQPAAKSSFADDDLDLFDDEIISDEAAEPETAKETEIFAPAVTAANFEQNFNHTSEPESYTTNASSQNGNGYENSYRAAMPASNLKAQDGAYHITFVEEKNASTRNMLLLGAFLVVTSTVLGGIVYSLFKQNPYIGSLNDDAISVVYTAEEPDSIEPDKPEVVKKNKGGGGGGGGDKDPTPVSKGVLATQMEKPLIPPSAKMDKVTNPDIPITPATEGNRKEKPSDDPYGNPKSSIGIASDGPGSGGGQGAGSGRGQGNGIGTGAGNGNGSGNGNGTGNGNGNGTGGGDNPPTMPEKPKAPVIEGLKILSKPRANYTDTARQNQVTGVVRVRVTFLPSGAIGSVTPMNSLPYGLTDQAIAAAKQIKFEPQKANGVAVSVTKVIEYSFSIY